MSPAALSVKIYGSYAVLIGVLSALFPSSVGGLLQVDPELLRWVGGLLIVFGVLLRQGADHDSAWLIRSSIWMRLLLGSGLIVTGMVHESWNLLFLSAVEFGSALWTRAASARHWQ